MNDAPGVLMDASTGTGVVANAAAAGYNATLHSAEIRPARRWRLLREAEIP
ncbi:MAG TPA: hypothetical protein VF331_03910 [Polyangiales bacterium]